MFSGSVEKWASYLRKLFQVAENRICNATCPYRYDNECFVWMIRLKASSNLSKLSRVTLGLILFALLICSVCTIGTLMEELA